MRAGYFFLGDDQARHGRQWTFVILYGRGTQCWLHWPVCLAILYGRGMPRPNAFYPLERDRGNVTLASRPWCNQYIFRCLPCRLTMMYQEKNG